MTEKKKPLSDIYGEEESEQKTYDSEPATPEDIERLNHGFYEQDLAGGLMNVQVPEEELERQREALKYAESFIDMSEECNTPCYKKDEVHLKLTPEQIVVLVEILQNYSLNMQNIEYLEEDASFSLYEQQIYVNLLRNKVDHMLNEYLRHRPYSAFVGAWAKKIGKDDLDKKDI